LAHFLLSIANVQPNQTVLIHSVAGGVGQAIVQLLAANVGNVNIIGIASKHKHEQITNVTNLFDASEYITETKKLYPDGIDVVFDCLGDGLNKGYNLVKPLGKFIVYGTFNYNAGLIGAAKYWWHVDKIKPTKLYEENKTISGFNLRQFLFNQNGHDQVRTVVSQIFDLFNQGKIKPVIDSKHAFEDVVDGMKRLEERKNIGKVILDPLQAPKPKPVEEEKESSKKRRFSSKGDDKKKDEKKTEDDGKATAVDESQAKSGDAEEKKPEDTTTTTVEEAKKTEE